MKGKHLLLFTALMIMAAFWSCKSYKVLRQTPDEFYSSKPVIDAFGKYDVYVHDPSGTYRVGQPAISNKGLSGELIPVKDSAAIAEISAKVKATKEKAHRFDLSFYTDKKVSDDKTASLNENEAPAREVILKKEDMREVAIKAVDKKKTFARAATGVLLLCALIVILLIGLLFAVGSATSADSSGNSTNSGTSGSNSGSGGSTSGCYIATMAYGSYDAPEVLVLRRFRDDVLSKSAGGRLFIKVYYRYSPGLVEVLKGHARVNATIRSILNKFVNYLEKK